MTDKINSPTFDDYLPLSATRIAPGEYVVETKSGVKLWYMEGRSLAEWIVEAINANGAEMRRQRDDLSEEMERCHRMLDEWYGEDPSTVAADPLEERLKEFLAEMKIERHAT